MKSKGRNLGGRAYLKTELMKLDLSRRRSVMILDLIFREMGLGLRRGEYVEFPFGYLKAEKRVSERWEAIGDEPMRPWFIDHLLDEEGERLLAGGQLTPWAPGWSREANKRSWVHRWDLVRRREIKEAAPRAKTAPRSK